MSARNDAIKKAKKEPSHGSYAYYKQRAREKKSKKHSLADVFAAKARAGGQGLSPF